MLHLYSVFRVSKHTSLDGLKIVGLSIVACIFMVAQSVGMVSAHQSPGSCNANRFNISIVKDRTQVFQGQTLTYTVTASNIDFGTDIACDITDASIQVTLPAADGTPTGQVVVLTPDQDFPAGSTTALIGTIPYVVNVNAGVVDIVAEARATGVLHDAPTDHAALIVKTIGTSVIEVPTTPGDDEGASGVGAAAAAANTPRLPNTGAAPRQ